MDDMDEMSQLAPITCLLCIYGLCNDFDHEDDHKLSVRVESGLHSR
jgi:hypothetical protein